MAYAKVICQPCAEAGSTVEAKYIAPQSSDAGRTIDGAVLICPMHADHWWDGGDWVGGFEKIPPLMRFVTTRA